MPARFDDSIPYFGGEVVAIGPLHPTEKLKEVCAWVYQPSPDGAKDAGATEMTTHRPEGKDAHDLKHFDSVDGERWLLLLKRISAADFRPGKAFALAVALVADLEGNHERVVWWHQPVEILEDEARVQAAHPTKLGRSPLLSEPPMEFRGLA